MPAQAITRCLVNLVELDPPRNGGQRRVAYMLARTLAAAHLSGHADVHFVVGWAFAAEFERWLGVEDLQVVPFQPEVDTPTGLCAQLRPDLIVSPLFGAWPFAGAGGFGRATHIVAMPDAMALDLPELLEDTERQRIHQRYQELRTATLVVASSEHARGRLSALLGLDADRIRVIPPTAEPFPDPRMDASPLVGGTYLFYPANGWPHKRHRLLLEAAKLIVNERPDVKLALAGWTPPGYVGALAAQVGFPSAALVELGFVREGGSMARLYRNADALLFTSAYEGFGMPLIEAMGCGCPVICGRNTALPEVAGSAALFVDSAEPADWARAYLEVLPLQREQLIARGAQRASEFTWEQSSALWRGVLNEAGLDLERTDVSRPDPATDYRVALRDLVSWSGRYASAMRRLDEKETNLVEFRERLHTSPRLWLANSPLARFWLFRAAARVAKVPLELLFPAAGFELIQHAPRPLRDASVRPLDKTSLENLPSIGIVTPCLNSARYVALTLGSVREQAYPRLQHVVQDGGSGDGTTDILRDLERQLTSWESAPDEGQAHALNLGFAHIDSEIMAYLNADDLLLPGALRYVGEYFAAHPDVDVIYSHRLCIDENGDELGRWILAPHSSATLYWADYVPQETLFWRRGIWERCGSSVDASYKFALDWDMLLRFQEAGAVIRRVPRFLALFRVHALQKTSATMWTEGRGEMERVRAMYLGRRPSSREIARHVHGYQLRSLLYRQAWQLGLLRT